MMMRWMYPPELERKRVRDQLDPVVAGARHGLSRELSIAIWERVCADATDAAGRRDTEQAERWFHEIAARMGLRGRWLHPEVGKLTRVGVELDGAASAGTRAGTRAAAMAGARALELQIRTPGRQTRVAVEAQRWTQLSSQPVSDNAPRPEPSRQDDRAPARHELPGALEVTQAMVALQAPTRPEPATPLNVQADAALRRLFDVDPASHAPERAPPPDHGHVDAVTDMERAVRLYREGALGAALRRREPGLADAVADALQQGKIIAPHPVDALRASAHGLGADLATAGRGLGRAAMRFLGTTPLAPVGQRAFGVADAWSGGAVRAWSDRARGWADGVSRRAMALRDGPAGHGAEDELAKLPASGGAPLPPALRARMEALFGHRFGQVRVHTDGAAAQAAHAAGARAVTLGSHIYFNRGQFNPGSDAGDRLLLHELTHVVQHDEGRLPQPAEGRVELSSPSDPAELEARAMEARVGEVRAAPTGVAGAPTETGVAGAPTETGVAGAATASIPGDAPPRHASAEPPPRHASAAASPRSAVGGPVAAAPSSAPGSDAPKAGRRASPNILGDAAHWVGDRIDDIENWAEDKIEGLVLKVAPGLGTLIHEGPGGLIKDALEPAISGWVGTITGGVNVGQIAGQLKGTFSSAFAVLEGAKGGDAKCCDTLVSGINAIREVAHAFMNNPVMDAIKGIFTKVSEIVGTVTKLVIGPAFEVLKTFLGGAWDAIKGVASTIGKWFDAVKNVAGKAFDWVAKKLGFTGGTGEGGLIEWLKDKAAAVWEKIKSTLQPVIGPLKVVAGVLLMFTGLPEIYAIIKYGPQLVEAVQWLWANRNNPAAVKQNPGGIGGSILPKILGVGQGFVGMVKSGVAWLVDKTTAFATGALELLGAVTGIPLLGMARGFVQTIVEGVQGVQQWASSAFTSAAGWLEGLYHRVADFIKPYAEVLCSVAMAVANPTMIPMILAGWAWRWLPDCIKPPLIDLLLDAVIAVLEGLPMLPLLGPLWPLLKSGVLGFLHAVRAKDPATKIKISNKLAKIISGASPMFLLGFVKGLLKGVWDGIKMPFEAIWMIAKGIGKAGDFFVALGSDADATAQKKQKPPAAATPAPKAAPTQHGGPPPPATHTLPAVPGEIKPDHASAVVGGIVARLNEQKPPRPIAQPGKSDPGAPATAHAAPATGNADPYRQLGQEARRMGGQLAGPGKQVATSFWPAVQELFSSGKGMSLDSLMAKLGKVWNAAKAAVASLGGKIADMICDFLIKDSAEEELGETIGYLVGMIAFQALLDYLSAGTWTGAMGVLSAIAKFLNWPMKFLEEAMIALKSLGGFLLKGIKELGGMVAEAGAGALREVVGAFGTIGTKLGEFAEELMAKFGGTAERDAAAVEADAARAVEADAARTTEADAARTAETDAARTEGRAAEEGSAAEKEAQKAEELVEAIEISKGIVRAEDAGHIPGPAIALSLQALKSRYSWIKGYEAKPDARGYELVLLASTHDLGHTTNGGVEPHPEGEPPKAEPPKAEPPKAEPPKAEPPKAEPEPVEPTVPGVEKYKDAPLGQKVGSGGNKDVYAIEGDNEHVIAILRPGKPAAGLDEEIALIKKLEGEGVPTVEILGKTTHNGQPAVVMERLEQGSKDVVKLDGGKIRRVGNSDLLNEQSVADLRRIKQTMTDAPLKVDDLQFLIGADGHVVVADPLKVVVGEAPSKNNKRMIDLLIEAAQENVRRGPR
jgi:hypothetical protein